MRRPRLRLALPLALPLVALALAGCGGGRPVAKVAQNDHATAKTPAAKAPRARARLDPPARARRQRRLARLDVYAATMSARLSSAVAGLPARVYVPDSGSATVTEIDPATFRVVRRFRVGEVPHHITPSWDLRRLYVDNTYSNTLTVLDPRSGRPTATLRVPDAYNLYFTLDGRKAIVVSERHQQLVFRTPHAFGLIKSVPIPGRGVDHLDFSADGRYLIASDEFSGDVVKVDTRRMAVVGALHVGGLPVDVRLAPDGSVFYVANQGRGGVSVIDPMGLRELAFIPTGAGAHGLEVSRDTKSLYVSNRRAGSISVIRFATRRVAATWRVGGSPDMMQISADGRALWVSNRYNGSVSVVATRTGRLLHVIRVGGEPHGLAYFPQPGRFSVGHNGVYR